MKAYKSLKYLALIIFVFSISCDEETTMEKELTSRLFRPINFWREIDGSDVDFFWSPIDGATYSLEYSRDSLKFETDLKIIELGKVSGYLLEGLLSDTQYSARIKAVSDNPLVDDSEYQEIVFKTYNENIFEEIMDEDISTGSVRLSWNSEREVGTIVVSTNGMEDLSINLTDEEKSAGEKLITGLESGTLYTFQIYLGDRLRGTISAITK